MKLRIVDVTWEDAASDQPWHYRGELLDAFMCRTVGILLAKDEEALHLTTTLSCGGAQAGRWRLPVGMVKKIKTLGTIDVRKVPE